MEYWAGQDIYRKWQERGDEREVFVLHDGPPYANGHLHIGHALNKILKDFVVRSQQMMGKRAVFTPGWDCHGLPIEWKIEEEYRKKGKDKDEVPNAEFRAQCREFAKKWIGVQKEEFQRLGVVGEWEQPYTTMEYEAEAAIVHELHKIAETGGLYRGAKPVMWSVVEKTALAEAEIEYEEYVSPTVFVKFPYKDVSLVIWTTTPWTIPANRAVAFSPKLDYAVYEVGEGSELVQKGERLVLAKVLAEQVFAAAKIEDYREVSEFCFSGGEECAHPLAAQGYDFPVAVLPADFVTADTGTGLVHVAPSHGVDDYMLGQKYGLEVPSMVDEGGQYYDHVPLFAKEYVYDNNGKDGGANGKVIGALIEAGGLMAKGKLRHSYPHSWRSKAPLIFRNTPQWFISMEKGGLREKALAAIEKVRWVPKLAKNRILSMVGERPDWVISRQRAWGVPIAIFANKKTGEVLCDPKVNENIVKAISEKGADAWFALSAGELLGERYDPEEWEKIEDILDVWFDSGCTHSFVLEKRGQKTPASLYLEGSDQHRGWFQSSLLVGCATRGHAPFEAVLTHGFVVDEKGRKMSKSSGNIIQPQKLVETRGSDILRLWIAACDYHEDLRCGEEAIKNISDAYRKMRNSFRFMLGNLHGFSQKEALPLAEMEELERLQLHRLYCLHEEVCGDYNDYDFQKLFRRLFHFITQDLSAFYFDIRKDALYCDLASSVKRRGARTVMDYVFHSLTRLLAPILPFTMEEVWQARDMGGSVHLEDFMAPPKEWHDPALAEKWEEIRKLRRVVTGALELERAEKRIGSSLEAKPKLYIASEKTIALLEGIDMAEIAITSQIEIIQDSPPAKCFFLEGVSGVGVIVEKAEGKKCERSWKILPDVGSDPNYPNLSVRDAEAVAFWDKGKA